MHHTQSISQFSIVQSYIIVQPSPAWFHIQCSNTAIAIQSGVKSQNPSYKTYSYSLASQTSFSSLILGWEEKVVWLARLAGQGSSHMLSVVNILRPLQVNS